MWGQIKLCIFEVKGWKEDDVEVERWHGGISDWDGKVAWVEEGGVDVQGVWQWGGWGCVPLATAVLCMESPQTNSSASHGRCRGRLLNISLMVNDSGWTTNMQSSVHLKRAVVYVLFALHVDCCQWHWQQSHCAQSLGSSKVGSPEKTVLVVKFTDEQYTTINQSIAGRFDLKVLALYIFSCTPTLVKTAIPLSRFIA